MQKLNKKNSVSVTGCLLLTVLLLMGCAGENDLEVQTMTSQVTGSQEAEEQVTEKQPAENQSAENQMQGKEVDVSLIYVQITGAVRWPGVYEMPTGARVFEVVEKAGGMLEEAEPTAVNQATALKDGQMIHIYTREEWEKARETQEILESTGNAGHPPVAEEDGRVNINTADKEALCSISGIGEARAESILTYRQEHGAFGSIEEIKNVSGIKDGLFQKIKDKIKV